MNGVPPGESCLHKDSRNPPSGDHPLRRYDENSWQRYSASILMSIKIVGIGLLDVIERAGNSGYSDEKDDEIHGDASL